MKKIKTVFIAAALVLAIVIMATMSGCKYVIESKELKKGKVGVEC